MYVCVCRSALSSRYSFTPPLFLIPLAPAALNLSACAALISVSFMRGDPNLENLAAGTRRN